MLVVVGKFTKKHLNSFALVVCFESVHLHYIVLFWQQRINLDGPQSLRINKSLLELPYDFCLHMNTMDLFTIKPCILIDQTLNHYGSNVCYLAGDPPFLYWLPPHRRPNWNNSHPHLGVALTLTITLPALSLIIIYGPLELLRIWMLLVRILAFV